MEKCQIDVKGLIPNHMPNLKPITINIIDIFIAIIINLIIKVLAMERRVIGQHHATAVLYEHRSQ